MKRFLLLPVALICLNCFSQQHSQTAVNSYFKNMLWTQFFDDFILKTPVEYPLLPWGSVFPDTRYVDNDIFTLEGLRNYKLFSQKQIMEKEFTYMIDAPFFSYIPKDSVLTLKALYKNRILYSVNLNRPDNSASSIEFIMPDNRTSESLVFDNSGNVVSRIKKENDNTVSTTTEKKSDKLSIATTLDPTKKYALVEENTYDNGVLMSKKIFRESIKNKKRKFESAYRYSYENSYLSKIESLNKKNKPISEVEFYTTNDTLHSINNSKVHREPNLVFYYYDNDHVVRKVIQNSLVSTELTYTYSNNKLSSINYNDLLEETVGRYEFEYNVNGDLITVTFKDQNYLAEFVVKRQVLFTYNENHNLKSLKVVDKNGVIENEVIFETDFKSNH